MKYRVAHSTQYTYSSNVSQCHNVAHLLPRNTPRQTCYSRELQVAPLPVDINEWSDLFGNRQASFSIQIPHNKLTVIAISEIEVVASVAHLDSTIPISWEQAVEFMRSSTDLEVMDARLYMLESEFIEFSSQFGIYNKPSFPPGRSLLDAVKDLMHRIYNDYTYDPGFSTVATPLTEVMKHQKGVCQDFAHLAIACLRMQGLAARYVSGYLETVPPEGEKKLLGADASHAWFSVYVPYTGWVDFDPTNAQIPFEQHITTAWGRDYADVAPLKGVVFGGGKHQLDVAVDVERI